MRKVFTLFIMLFGLMSSIIAKDVTVYFANSYAWTDVYAYVWSSDTGEILPWRGEPAIKTNELYAGYEVYSYTFDYDKAQNIIFNGYNSHYELYKTIDMEINLNKTLLYNGEWYKSTLTTVFYVNTSEWTGVRAYAWSDETGELAPWPGTLANLTSKTYNDYEIYSYTFNYTEAQNIIFCNNLGSDKTADLVVNVTKPYLYDGYFYDSIENIGNVDTGDTGNTDENENEDENGGQGGDNNGEGSDDNSDGDIDNGIIEDEIPEDNNSNDNIIEVDNILYKFNTEFKIAKIIGLKDKTITSLILPSFVTYNGVTYTIREVEDKAFSDCPNLTSVDWNVIGTEELLEEPMPILVNPGKGKVTICVQYLNKMYGQSIGITGTFSGWNTNDDFDTLSPVEGTLSWYAYTIDYDSESEENAFKIALYESKWDWDMQLEAGYVIEGNCGCISERDNFDLYSDNQVIYIEANEFGTNYNEQGEIFYNTPNITSFTFGEEVINIPNNLCNEMNKLTTVIWNAKRCKDFDWQNPFYNNNSITSFVFGDKVEHIPAYLCEGLDITEVLIPNSVTSIGSCAFRNCDNLKVIQLLTNNTNFCIEDGVLYNKDKSSLILVPYGKKYDTLTIPASVKRCEDCSISDNIEKVNYLGSVDEWARISFGENTFRTVNPARITGDLYINNELVTDIKITKVDSINYDAFSELKHLKSVEIGDNVKYIGSSAFSNCESLTSVSIGNGITSLEESFYGCINLTSITLGKNVNNITCSAFYDCKKIQNITCYANVPPRASDLYCPQGNCYEHECNDLFDNYNSYLYVPCESFDDYDLDAIWGKFKHIECINTEDSDSDESLENAIIETLNDADIIISEGLITISADTEFHIYNSIGQDVTSLNGNLVPGIYLVQIGEDRVKVMLK